MIDRRNFSKTFMATLGSLAVANPLFSNDLLDDFKKSNPKKLGIALVGKLKDLP